MEFFKTIAEHLQDGQQLTLIFKKSGDNLVASMLPDTKGVKDKAVSKIKPLTMSGTPEDFENDFEKALAPIEKALGLVADVEGYEKDVEETRKNTEMVTKKKEGEDKIKKHYNDLITLVKKNLDEHKFKDAKSVLVKALELSCADKAEIERIDVDIQKMSGVGDMFGGFEDKSDGNNVEVSTVTDKSEEKEKETETEEEEED